DGQAVILRDEIVGIVAKGNRHARSAAAGAKLDRDREIIVTGMKGHFRPLDQDERRSVPDLLTAFCVVSQTDRTAEVPGRLARHFAKAMNLKVFKLAPGRGL